MAFLASLYNKEGRTLRLTSRGRAISILAVIIAAGLALGILNAPLASSAANDLAITHTDQAAPTDPQSPLWNGAPEAEIPLSAQQIYQPGGGTTRSVRVRILEDGHNISFRVSWDDDTRNDSVGTTPSDAAAIQLPVDPGHLPYQCMGQSTSKVNIWQWKAALEKQAVTNEGAMPLENNGTRNLNSNGICKAVDVPGLAPTAYSYHDGRQWFVVFNRALGGGSGSNLDSAPIQAGVNTSVAFAVWNGAHGEARGMKAVSTWNTLVFTAPPANAASSLLTLAAVVVVSAGIVAFTMRRLAS